MRHVVLALLIGCGGLTGPGVDGATDADVDAIEELGPCNPTRPTLPKQEACDSTLNQICQQWAQQAAGTEYGASDCETNTVTFARYCGDPGCSPECLGGYVCASVAPNGPRTCVAACTGP